MLSRYGIKSSKSLKRMFKRWRRQIRCYIDWAVRNAVEWLYQRGVRRILIGYPKYVSQEPCKGSKINFEIAHIWNYGHLLRRLKEIAEEYGIEVEYIDKENTSKHV